MSVTPGIVTAPSASAYGSHEVRERLDRVKAVLVNGATQLTQY